MSDEVIYEVDGRIATITVNRPERMNAMTNAMYAAVSDGFRAAEGDPAVWCVIVTGAGDRAFSAGHDLYELADPGARPSWQPHRAERFDQGLECSKPTIAVVNGYCLAGGMELALFCDIRIAAETAQFGSPEVKWNILHGYGALRLPEIIGMSQTMYLLLTGDFIDAATAHRIGLVSHVVPPAALMPTAREVAERIASNGPGAARLIKDLAYRGRDLPLREGLRLYREYQAIATHAADHDEGTRAFAERRQPEFKDE